MRILLIEDDPSLSELILRILQSASYQVTHCETAEEAVDRPLRENFDVILLDLMLPRQSGLELLRHWREKEVHQPVLVLSGIHQINKKVEALDAGADDYMIKPFAMPELLARIRALLRREGGERNSLLRCGNIRLDPAGREAWYGENLLDLSSKEFSILEFLLYNQKKALSRNSILENVWGGAAEVLGQSNNLDVHIKNLRKKLKAAGMKADCIQTVRGIGYKLDEPAGE